MRPVNYLVKMRRGRERKRREAALARASAEHLRRQIEMSEKINMAQGGFSVYK